MEISFIAYKSKLEKFLTFLSMLQVCDYLKDSVKLNC